MPSPSRSSTRCALVGGAVVAGAMLTSVSAFADPPPTPPATPAAIAPAPPPFADAARPPQIDPSRPQYPTHFYVPVDWSAPPMQGMPGMPSRRVWYGWQTLLVHAAATTVGLTGLFGGMAARSDALFLGGSVIGGASLLFSGPIVHWAHGNTVRGFAVLGLNFGAPLVGAGLGAAIGCAAGGCSDRSDGFSIPLGMMFGGIGGALTAVIVDVTALSYETTAPVASSVSKRFPGWTILPDLYISRDKTTFGFAGVF